MLTTVVATAMVLVAGYLWRSAGLLRRCSAQPHGERDVTSTGAILLMRATCVAALIVAALAVSTSQQPVNEANPDDPTGLSAQAPAAEPSLVQE